jgi:PleD family two-component response regulator
LEKKFQIREFLPDEQHKTGVDFKSFYEVHHDRCYRAKFVRHRSPSLAEVRCPLNILIVDDERSVREACREVAASLGTHTTALASAEQA